MPQKTPSINILSRFRLQLLIQAKRLYVIQGICFSILLLFGMMVVGLVSYQFYLSFQLDEVNEQIGRELGTLKELTAFEMEYVNFKNKADSLLVVGGTLQEHQALVEGVFELLPQGVLVKSFTIDETGVISFVASSLNPEIVHAFFSSLRTQRVAENATVRKAEITDVSVDEEGVYSFGLRLELEVL